MNLNNFKKHIAKKCMKLFRQAIDPSVPVPTQRNLVSLGSRFLPTSDEIKEYSQLDSPEITGELCIPKKLSTEKTAVMYLHGGGYSFGSPQTHRSITSKLAEKLGMFVMALDYRLAPEYPYPCGLEDAFNAYKKMCELHEEIILIGDSAGGGLVYGLQNLIIEEKLKKPLCTVTMSPWVDLSIQGFELSNIKEDFIVQPEIISQYSKLYAANETLKNPYVSPTYYDKLDQYSPTLIQIDSHETLVGQVELFANKLLSKKVEVYLNKSEGLWHIWHLFGDWIKESTDSMDEICEFIQCVQEKNISNNMA